jgi:hypothetical protein
VDLINQTPTQEKPNPYKIKKGGLDESSPYNESSPTMNQAPKGMLDIIERIGYKYLYKAFLF